jgi:hypothetical protein
MAGLYERESESLRSIFQEFINPLNSGIHIFPHKMTHDLNTINLCLRVNNFNASTNINILNNQFIKLKIWPIVIRKQTANMIPAAMKSSLFVTFVSYIYEIHCNFIIVTENLKDIFLRKLIIETEAMHWMSMKAIPQLVSEGGSLWG